MSIASRLTFLIMLASFSASHVGAQQIDSGAHLGERIYVDAVVSSSSGLPISNLQRKDFTIFDNNLPQAITSFEAVDGRRAEVAVTIVLDLGESSLPLPELRDSLRGEAATTLADIKRFLKENGGELVYPTTVEFVTPKGLELRGGPSRDGNAISASLNKPAVSTLNLEDLIDPRRREERFAASFQAFAALVALERDKPGRKIVMWVSRGWPPVVPRDFDQRATKQQKQQVQQIRLQMFGNVVQLTRQLYQGQITVYSISPPAPGDSDSGFTNGDTYLRQSRSDNEPVVVQSPSDVRWNDLEVQPIALRSGGLTLYSGHDLASSLRQCIADASFFYELSFEPTLTDEPNKYHSLKVQVAKPGLSVRTRQGYYSQPWPAEKFASAARKVDEANSESSDLPAREEDSRPETYVDSPVEQLIQRIPDLKGLQPAQDQNQLPEILEKMGQSIDNFVHNVGDLIASEDVTQERLHPNGKIKAKERVQDDYLILHHGYEWGADAEYRMDKSGKRVDAIGLNKGFLVTSGYALGSISFSSVTQTQSNFRYLGYQKIGARDAFVLAFAQKPGEATFTTVMQGTGGNDVNMLTQGILWVDKSNFYILRLRSDLLTPNDEIRLSQLTTDVTFTEVYLQGNPNPLWLPKDANVFIEIGNEQYRNLHRYTNYRRYQVNVKIGNTK